MDTTRIGEIAIGVALAPVILALAWGILWGGFHAVVWILTKAQEATAHQQSFKREPREGA